MCTNHASAIINIIPPLESSFKVRDMCTNHESAIIKPAKEFIEEGKGNSIDVNLVKSRNDYPHEDKKLNDLSQQHPCVIEITPQLMKLCADSKNFDIAAKLAKTGYNYHVGGGELRGVVVSAGLVEACAGDDKYFRIAKTVADATKGSKHLVRADKDLLDSYESSEEFRLAMNSCLQAPNFTDKPLPLTAKDVRQKMQEQADARASAKRIGG
jgi:hypothetical protein